MAVIEIDYFVSNALKSIGISSRFYKYLVIESGVVDNLEAKAVVKDVNTPLDSHTIELFQYFDVITQRINQPHS